MTDEREVSIESDLRLFAIIKSFSGNADLSMEQFWNYRMYGDVRKVGDIDMPTRFGRRIREARAREDKSDDV